jgi:hypothetical protein
MGPGLQRSGPIDISPDVVSLVAVSFQTGQKPDVDDFQSIISTLTRNAAAANSMVYAVRFAAIRPPMLSAGRTIRQTSL